MYYLFYFLFIFLITENIYEASIPGLNFFDEFITILAIIFLLIPHNKYYKSSSPEKKSIYYSYIVFIIGCFSTLMFHIQPNFSGVWRDSLAIMKFPLCYYAFIQKSYNYNKDIINNSIINFTRIFTIIACIAAIINFIYPIELFNRGRFRYGMPLFYFIYSHATFLISTLIILISILISNGFKKNIPYIIMCMVCIVLTFRSKPILIIMFVSIMYILRKRINKLSKKKKFFYFIFILSFTIFFSYSQLNDYINYGSSAARGAFYIFGIESAVNFFPLGSGFCTFASTLSHTYYSPLYYDYNMQYISGITPDDGSYAGDTFWPNIFGQYGFLGLFFYLTMLYYIYKSINNRFKKFSDKWIGAMSLFVYSIVAAFAESFYTNTTGVIYAIILAIYIGNNNKYLTT